MSLYTKGAWRRYQIDPAELGPAWERFASDPKKLFEMSSLAARATLFVAKEDELESTIGINPPHRPLMDDAYMESQEDTNRYVLPHIAANLRDEACEQPWELPEGAEVPCGSDDVLWSGWGNEEAKFRLMNAQTPVIGFWIVQWKRTDLVDKPSIREAKACSHTGMPYKLLSAEMRKDLFGGEKEWEVVMVRKQAPCIIDLRTGSVWLGTGSTGFAKAFVNVMSRGLGLLVTPGELVLGNNRDWVKVALNVLRDKDIYRLERQEAIERFMASSAADEIEEPVDNDAAPFVEQDSREKDEQAAQDRTLLSNLAVWAPDEGGVVMTLMADASVALKPEARSSVATVDGSDALELFHRHTSAELLGCLGIIEIPAPPSDDKGPLARVSVDFTADLSLALYRNLEFLGTRSMWNEMLEEPHMRGTGFNEVVESNLPEKTYAHRYSRYWYRYYLQLTAFENALIKGFAGVLELDPSKVGVTSRSLFGPQKEAEDDAVETATRKLAQSVRENLLPGESVTLEHGGRSTTVEVPLKGDFLDDIPEAD